jgi:GT2 family glycosyltransferase
MEKLGVTPLPPVSQDPVRLSVVVPVRNGERFLAVSLPALRASDFPAAEWELIVVDDASSDGSPELASRFANLVLRSPEPRGAAATRNLGAARASGPVLVFIDADVSVHPDVLRRFAEILDREPDVAAIFGAYDTRPVAPGLVSQYRNLLHHYVHLQSPGEAETFWTGCGAMRREVFAEIGGFTETQASLEDIELGYRARARGYRILLRPEIQGTHLKRWTLRSMITTDLFARGVTWMRLRLARPHRGRTATLNLRPTEKLYTLLTGLGACALAVAALTRTPTWLLLSLGCLTVVILGNLPLLRWFAGERGLWFALRIVPLRLLYYGLNLVAAMLGWWQHMLATGTQGSRLSTASARESESTAVETSHSRSAPASVANWDANAKKP